MTNNISQKTVHKDIIKNLTEAGFPDRLAREVECIVRHVGGATRYIYSDAERYMHPEKTLFACAWNILLRRNTALAFINPDKKTISLSLNVTGYHGRVIDITLQDSLITLSERSAEIGSFNNPVKAALMLRAIAQQTYPCIRSLNRHRFNFRQSTAHIVSRLIRSPLHVLSTVHESLQPLPRTQRAQRATPRP